MKLEKIKGETNPKIIRKITKYLVEGKFPDEQIYEESDAFKVEEDKFRKFLLKDLSTDSLRNIAESLEVEIDESYSKNIIYELSKIKDAEAVISFFADKYINHNYGEYTFILLKLCTNWWLNKNNYSMIIFYPSYMRGINQLIDEKEDFKLIEKMIKNFYQDTFYKNEKHIVRTELDIKQKLTKLKPVLEHQFKVKHVKLFGSYAKNKQTQFSDIDLIVETYENINENDLKSLDDYLSAILEIKVNSVLDGSFIKDKIITEVF